MNLGQMEESMREILKMGRKMEREHLNGPMVTNMLVHGEMIKCMALVYMSTKKKRQRNKVNGSMEKDTLG